MINQILEELLTSVSGAHAVIFLDGDGEAIAHAGDSAADIRLVGAWKEIQFDHVKIIADRLKLGNVQAVLFSRDEGNELIVPVTGEYCLLLFMSSYANVHEAMGGLRKAIVLLKKEVE
ncbi:MAG TPA: roadblock/LC7 domain-containing protein [Nitrospirota bacterium]|nr:roadblock/LC7 domain-containing protein [Nitrospirota bacterium]